MVMLPTDFADLMRAPALVINLDRQPGRWDVCRNTLADAGFEDVRRFGAVDGHDRDTCRQLYTTVHNVRFDLGRCWSHGDGCMLSHLAVWKHIIDTSTPVASVFEDDVFFHSRWAELAPQYYAETPRDSQVVYMGHHCGVVVEGPRVQTGVPAYCLHAYTVTLEGARRLYDMITRYPFEGEVHTAVDIFLVRLQREAPQLLRWACWNGTGYLCQEDYDRMDPVHRHKEGGLAFQRSVAAAGKI